ESDIPAEANPPLEEARVHEAHAHQGRPCRARRPSPQGSSRPDRVGRGQVHAEQV
ncbi:MAG: LSU ribosomal protein L34p, partial [uncultured Thermomicrobiales bacterium]